MAKVAVLVIHGMGSQDRGYAQKMMNEINGRIDRSSDIVWKEVYWTDLLKQRQENFFQEAKRIADMDYTKLRKFAITALGDVSAYQQVNSPSNSTYAGIHERIENDIHDLYTTQLNGVACPMIVLAHSLGGHIMSNYIYDLQKSPGHDNDFENMEHLSGMITFGCNIPLFTFAYRRVEPIRFPGNALTPQEKAKAKWQNYYDPDDILAYPLKAVEGYRDMACLKDIFINAGGLFSSWNPLSHNQYWTDDDFTKPVSRYLESFLS